ncbi:hypothetical protein Rsub_01333 [Raphidocelis subcapitata]|uniref:Uncharacterized protein n=1 Tax=Raphidocelis subcapitata TaxID=307507 RepID=A0A2V0NM97_9CHLO|nr:hypothetical protein Rsub_01333 [Raphidocelis subcapitata]|eukprot:GBF88618.1 hypothetical protein Rsub_01333 [Raphidocelis subcapitata]
MAAGRAIAMGLIERTRQRMGISDPNFMLREADEFAHHMRAFEHAIREYSAEVQDYLLGLNPLLNAPLPRVWRHVPGTDRCESVRTHISHGHPGTVGGDYRGDALRSHVELLERRAHGDIAKPLRAWLAGLEVARERFETLERLRASVDSERRRANKAFRRAEARIREAYGAAAAAARGAGPAWDDFEYDFGYGGGGAGAGAGGGYYGLGEAGRVRALEDYERMALHEERRLAAYVDSFREQERLVFEQLSGLVRDAAWLESYCAAALLVVKEAVQAAALCLGPTKQPLPTHRTRRDPARVEYGGLADNTPLVTELAPRALELAQGAPARGPRLKPYAEIHVKRGIALAPTEAEYRARALERVPPVTLAAAGLPEAEVTEEMRRVERERARTLGLEHAPASPEGAPTMPAVRAVPLARAAEPPQPLHEAAARPARPGAVALAPPAPEPVITPQKEFERERPQPPPAPAAAAHAVPPVPPPPMPAGGLGERAFEGAWGGERREGAGQLEEEEEEGELGAVPGAPGGGGYGGIMYAIKQVVDSPRAIAAARAAHPRAHPHMAEAARAAPPPAGEGEGLAAGAGGGDAEDVGRGKMAPGAEVKATIVDTARAAGEELRARPMPGQNPPLPDAPAAGVVPARTHAWSIAAAAVRFASVRALAAAVERRVADEGALRAAVDAGLLPLLHQCLDEDWHPEVRLAAAAVEASLLAAVGRGLSDEQRRAVYTELLKRLDDSSNAVRVAACGAIAAFAGALPAHYCDANSGYLAAGVVPHMDDGDAAVSAAAAAALEALAAVKPAAVAAEVSKARPVFRAVHLCDRVLAACGAGGGGSGGGGGDA